MLTLPEHLIVRVRWFHLARGDRKSYDDGALALAVRESLTVPSGYSVTVSEHQVRIWRGSTYIGRYFIPDAAWKLQARHNRGMRVKPAVFAFGLVYHIT